MADANNASDHSLLWGYSVEFWDRFGIWALGIGALLGVAALALTAVSAYVLYRVADKAQIELVAETKAGAERIAKSDERMAELNNQTEHLKADNLALQTVLLPRHVGLVGLNGPPPAVKWFAGVGQFAGTKILIQVIDGDPEARNLANEIVMILFKFGWLPEIIDASRSGESLNLSEGVHIYSPASYKAWSQDPAHQEFGKLATARWALKEALTKAGLGVGNQPVSDAIIVVDFPPDSDAARSQYGKFSPPLDGIYVQIGSRPVGATVAWIKQGRPNAFGAIPAPASTENTK
jgi:hypothetical protein